MRYGDIAKATILLDLKYIIALNLLKNPLHRLSSFEVAGIYIEL